MNAKRWEIIDEEFISYTGGTAQLISNGECKVHLWETPKDAQLFCDKLNKLHEENTMLKERRHEDINDLSVIAMKYKALEKENEQLKKRLNAFKPIIFEDVNNGGSSILYEKVIE